MEGHMPLWGPVGTRDVNWHGQIAALLRDGYPGFPEHGDPLAWTAEGRW